MSSMQYDLIYVSILPIFLVSTILQYIIMQTTSVCPTFQFVESRAKSNQLISLIY